MNTEILSIRRKEVSQKVAKNIPVLRAKLGITQGQLALNLGITRQSLGCFENGKRLPSWTTTIAIVSYFLLCPGTDDLIKQIGLWDGKFKDLLGIMN